MSPLIRWGLWLVVAVTGSSLFHAAWTGHAWRGGDTTPFGLALGASCAVLASVPMARVVRVVRVSGRHAAARDGYLAVSKWAERRAARCEHRRIADMAAAAEMNCRYQAEEAIRRVREIRGAA